VYDPEGTAHLVPSEHLPWLLPEDVDFTLGKHASPLMSSVELKERVTRIFGEGWTPEYDTLDTFVDSSWYFMRYLDVENTETFADLATLQKWMPVDRYSGGSEHTTLHLLYARFFNKALFDLGLAPTSEPFIERMNRGLIADSNGQKMSKSKGNTINPDEPVQQYGADAVRMYLAFIGPYNEPGTYPWKPEGVEAMRRFLDRVNLLKERVSDEISVTPDESILLARASDKMSSDIERFKLNTAVSAFMILMNDLEKQSTVSSAAYLHLLTLLAPFAPHLAEGLYGELGLTTGGNGKTYDSIHQIPWPAFDPALLKTQSVTIGIQVAGKRRGEMTISAEATLEEAVSEAKNLPQVAALYEAGQEPRVVYVPGKIFNIVP
jgi:leucyl-tRNA synthetase